MTGREVLTMYARLRGVQERLIPDIVVREKQCELMIQFQYPGNRSLSLSLPLPNN